MKKVYILPNLFTTASLLLGVLAIFNTLSNGSVGKSIWYIAFAAILDSLDGKIARITKSESFFGLNYDSLSDLVSFGVAPAVVMYPVLQSLHPKVVRGVLAFFIICSALRLARYNVQANKEEKVVFMGLPTPGSAAVVLSYLLFVKAVDVKILYMLFPVLIIFTSYLMISSVHYPGFKSINFRQRSPFQVLVIVTIFVAFLVALKEYFSFILFPIIFTYLMVFFGKFLIRKLSKRSLQKEDEAVNESI